MRAVLSCAELGCYLVIPLKYEAGGVKEGWIAAGTTQWRRS